MLAVRGHYDGNTIRFDNLQIKQECEVIVTFLDAPLFERQNPNNTDAKRRAFEELSEFKKTLPSDFDYRKELEASRAVRYDSPTRR
jgi:hypothetical protein